MAEPSLAPFSGFLRACPRLATALATPQPSERVSHLLHLSFLRIKYKTRGCPAAGPVEGARAKETQGEKAAR